MKQTLLLIVLTLGMTETSFSKQLTGVLPSNNSSKVLKKTKQLESDGFIWYKIKGGNYYGAQNEKGEYIIPIKYDEINYVSSPKESTCFFKVKSNNYLGSYSTNGIYSIKIESHFSSIDLHRHYVNGEYKDKIYWVVEKNGRKGIADAQGELVIGTLYDNIKMQRVSPHYMFDKPVNPKLSDAVYFKIEKDGNYGISDLNGNIICPVNYKRVDIEVPEDGYWLFRDDGYPKTYVTFEREKKAGVVSKINYSDLTHYNYSYSIFSNIRHNSTKIKSTDAIVENAFAYYIIEEDGRMGLVDSNQKWIIPLGINYSEISYAGGSFIKVMDKRGYGILGLDGKTIIPTSRGYTSIANYNNDTKSFAFTKSGYSGICNTLGQETSTKKRPLTIEEIKGKGGYDNAVPLKNGNTTYYKVCKNSHYGLTNAEGKIVVPAEMEALETAGTGYLKFKVGGFWGLMNYQGRILIDTSRGYTSIGNFISFTKRFPYTMSGYKGECDINGRQISKIKIDTPKHNTSDTSSSNSSYSSSSSSSSTNTSSSSNSGNKTTTVVVEHHRDPVPVQEWVQCTTCWGSGTCPDCAGSGTKYVGDNLRRCWRCGGRGKCSSCSGQGGRYYTVYK